MGQKVPHRARRQFQQSVVDVCCGTWACEAVQRLHPTDGTQYPLDSVKTRLQAYKFASFSDCLRHTYRTEGLHGFYRGKRSLKAAAPPPACSSPPDRCLVPARKHYPRAHRLLLHLPALQIRPGWLYLPLHGQLTAGRRQQRRHATHALYCCLLWPGRHQCRCCHHRHCVYARHPRAHGRPHHPLTARQAHSS